MPSFVTNDIFSSANSFNQVKFGSGARVLEVELNELQKMVNYKIEAISKLLITDGFINKTPMRLTAGTLIVEADTIVIAGKAIEFLDPMQLVVTNGDHVYLALTSVEVTGDSVLKRNGNLSGGASISNGIYDERLGTDPTKKETSRRVQLQIQLTKTQNISGAVYIDIATIGSGSFTDLRSRCTPALYHAPYTWGYIANK